MVKKYTNKNSRDDNRQDTSLDLMFKQKGFYEKACRDVSCLLLSLLFLFFKIRHADTASGLSSLGYS